MQTLETHALHNERSLVLTKAVLRAAELLKVNQAELATVLGVSEGTVSNMKRGAKPLPADRKSQEVAKFFIRIYRSLDSIVGGDDEVASKWLRAPNVVLGSPPLLAMKSLTGLVHVMEYLDQRRAPL